MYHNSCRYCNGDINIKDRLLNDTTKLNCGHIFHSECLYKLMKLDFFDKISNDRIHHSLRTLNNNFNKKNNKIQSCMFPLLLSCPTCFKESKYTSTIMPGEKYIYDRIYRLEVKYI